MQFKALLKLAAAAALLLPAQAVPSNVKPRATGSLDSFIASESTVARQGILNNIGSGGSKVPGAAPGLVIASPSKSNPDCGYSVDSIED
jgi:glucoamylase